MSDNEWLDRAHGVAVRSALRRIWPETAEKVVCVGGTEWAAWSNNEFRPFWLVRVDLVHAAALRGQVPGLHPDLVCYVDSITALPAWRRSISSAVGIGATRILVLDNLLDPTPEWQKLQTRRVCIPNSELVEWLSAVGYDVEKAVAVDVAHRRPFLATPRWLHPLIWPFVGWYDVWWAKRHESREARHSAWLFKRA